MNRRFQTNPSRKYRQAVAVLKDLIAAETEDSAARAFAEAISDPILQIYRQSMRPATSSHVCLHRLVGERCKGALCGYGEMGIPGSDHVSEWVRRSNKSRVVVSQPYEMSFEDIKDTVKFCEEKGLRADIDTFSWHFPGRTLRVRYKKAGE